ncbi:hypothetical protein D9M71_575320 [compost metagenome]
MVQLCLHVGAAAEQGELFLPDLPYAKFLAQHQHRQLGRLAQGDFLELLQGVLDGDHQLQLVLIEQLAVQPRLARRQEADADIQVTGEQASLDIQPGQLVDLHHQLGLRLAQAFQQHRHQGRVHRLQNADGQAARSLATEAAQGLAGALQTVQQR